LETYKQALAIDSPTHTTFWRDSVAKEMKNGMPAFTYRDDNKVPVGYKQNDCHMVYNVKIDLARKAWLVAGGNQTDIPKESVYSSVVSRDSVRIALKIASLNDLNLIAADIQNAYLNAPTKEKCYTVAGLEFGSDNEGRPVLITKALYGLRSSGARWRDHLADTIQSIGFSACLDDLDVWLRPSLKPSGAQYYEYILVYFDDILAISLDPQSIIDTLSKHYTLKAESVRAPKEYLGSDIQKYNVQCSDSTGPTVERYWSMSARTYIKRVVTEVKQTLAEDNQRLKTKVTTPIADKYCAELDATLEIDSERTTNFQALIGVLW
jgi:hypothetical protein